MVRFEGCEGVGEHTAGAYFLRGRVARRKSIRFLRLWWLTNNNNNNNTHRFLVPYVFYKINCNYYYYYFAST